MVVLVKTKAIIYISRYAMLTSVLYFVLGLWPFAYGECHAPHYREGKPVAQTSSTLIKQVSIDLDQFAPAALICLAHTLKLENRDLTQITVFIFSDHESAKYYLPMGVEWTAAKIRWASNLHAAYFYDAEKHEEYLLLIPDHLAEDEAALDTRIDLSAARQPSCRLQLKGRCLMAFEHFGYPRQYEKPIVAGSVTLTGIIQADGSVSNIRPAEVVTGSKDHRSLLIKTAVANLRTWRFEPTRQSDPVHLRYSFEIVNAPSLQGKTQLRFSLPEQVTICTGPQN